LKPGKKLEYLEEINKAGSVSRSKQNKTKTPSPRISNRGSRQASRQKAKQKQGEKE